ncbi:hypothetical protein M426DRAFT_23987 [Hypoxylon sp. CI-4A]|nr:hypothetical protein M426DRAFT_23987 [Hypoxylon sp. CI-4A]
MKATYAIFLAAQIFSTLGSPAAASPETDCGDLGVFNTTQLPEIIDPNAVRKCVEHPLGKVKDVVISERSVGGLVERACWHGKPVGCTAGSRAATALGAGPPAMMVLEIGTLAATTGIALLHSLAARGPVVIVTPVVAAAREMEWIGIKA